MCFLFFFKKKKEYEISACLVGSEMCIRDIFFFKQKTAYEMLRSLVGSEMCIRDKPVIKISFSEMQVRSSSESKGFPTDMNQASWRPCQTQEGSPCCCGSAANPRVWLVCCFQISAWQGQISIVRAYFSMTLPNII